jgi:hypothetical protein
MSTTSIKRMIPFGIALLVFLTLCFGQVTLAQEATTASQVELVGTIDSVTTTSITINQQTIDTSHAEIRITLEAGLRVKVEGNLQPDGQIVAREVKLADIPADTVNVNESEIIGILTSFEGTTMVIAGQTIDVSGAEIYPGVGVNETVEAKVTLVDGQWIAREVQLADFRGDHTPVVIPDDCVPAQPANWTTYTVQTGDTLSTIAEGSDASLRELAFVNCIANARSIVAGMTLFVPQTPVMSDDHGQDGLGHDQNDDHGQDGLGHDVGDDHGQDGPNHDQGDDHGQGGSGHDAGDDHGGNSGHG